MRLRPWILAALLIAVGTPAPAAPWHDVPADAPENPGVLWGRLPNGLRYAVLHNGAPQGQLSLRLLVSVGSLMEEPSERGIAHFIEHMAFRGTRNFPRGSLLPILERMGMGLGPDTAAFTSYDFTVYQLELPDTRPATVQLALSAFREFAENITFDRRMVDIERGVILSEASERDTPQYRVAQYNDGFLWPGSLFANRAPIGLERLIRTFRPSDLRAFYNAWYRPERMAVIAVGDVNPRLIADQIDATFASLRARAPARPEPSPLYPISASPGDVRVLHEPGWAGATLIFEHPFALPTGPNTHADRALHLREMLGFGVFQRRLETAAHEEAGSFSEPDADLSNGPYGWGIAGVTVAARLPLLLRSVGELEQAHRQALTYGFTSNEVALVASAVRAGLDQAARSWSTKPSSDLAAEIVNHLISGWPLFTAETWRRDLDQPLKTATPENVLSAFRAAWGVPARPHVLLVTIPSVRLDGGELAALLNASRKKPVSPPSAGALGAIGYEHFGTPGILVKDQVLPDLGLRLARFANGVRFNFKATRFQANQVDFCVRFGDGRASAPPNLGLIWFASRGLIPGGVGKHSALELSDLLAGHDISLEFSVQSDSCLFHGHCARQELSLALRVVAAYMTDAAFRPDELREIRGDLESYLGGLIRSPDGLIDAFAESILTGGDPRFRPPQFADIEREDFGQVKPWLQPQLLHGPVEVSIVGDASWTEAEPAVAATLGALNPRPAPRADSLGAPVHFARGPQKVGFNTSPGVVDAGLAIFWPAPGATATPLIRRCTLLSTLLGQRIFTRLREQLGETYSPTIDFVHQEAPPGLNYFEVRLDVAPRHLKSATRIIEQEARYLTRHVVDPDNFYRACQPLFRQQLDELQDNEHWLFGVLESAQQNPSHIADARSREADYRAITAAELRPLAARYFTPANTFVIFTQPPRTP
jgi:zinc protease